MHTWFSVNAIRLRPMAMTLNLVYNMINLIQYKLLNIYQMYYKCMYTKLSVPVWVVPM